MRTEGAMAMIGAKDSIEIPLFPRIVIDGVTEDVAADPMFSKQTASMPFCIANMIVRTNIGILCEIGNFSEADTMSPWLRHLVGKESEHEERIETDTLTP